MTATSYPVTRDALADLADLLTGAVDVPSTVTRFVCHRGKRPLRPGGRPADVTDSATWSPIAACRADVVAGRADGVGIVLTGDGLACLDLDHCRDRATGGLTDEAAAIVADLDTFTEVSRSGTGLHLWFTVPAGTTFGRCRTTRPDGQGIELYTAGRYIALTGDRLPGTPATIAPRADVVAGMASTWFPTRERTPRPAPTTTAPGSADDDDTRLMHRWRALPIGGTPAGMGRVLDGDASLYGDDESRADFHAMKALAWIVGDDVPTIARLYRMTTLATLDKDGAARGDRADYVDRTARAAIEAQTGRAPVTRPPSPIPGPGHRSEIDTPAESDAMPPNVVTLAEWRARALAAERRADDAEGRATSAEAIAARQGIVLHRMAELIRNPDMDPATKLVVLAVHHETAAAASRGADVHRPVAVPLYRIGDRTGLSTDTVSRKLKGLEATGVLSATVTRTRPLVADPDTGEMVPGAIRSEKRVRLADDLPAPIDFLAAAATVQLTRAHGGTRTRHVAATTDTPTCPDHPAADVHERRTWVCVDCGQVVADEVTIHHRTDDVAGDPLNRHHAAPRDQASTGGPVVILNPQDADSARRSETDADRPQPTASITRLYPHADCAGHRHLGAVAAGGEEVGR